MCSKWLVAVLSFSILLGCPDDLPDEPTDAGLVIDYCDGLLDCNDVSVQEPDTKKTAVDAAAQQLCSTVWDFNVTEGGIPSHPVVNSEGTVTITTGNSFLRVSANGGEACPSYFKGDINDGHFGSPTQTTDDMFFVGTAKGKLYAITDKCTNMWPSAVLVQDESKMTDGLLAYSGQGPYPITEAPIYQANDNAIYVLDHRPALHKCTKLSGQGSCNDAQAGHYYVLDKNLPGANAVYAGGDQPFIAFPSQKMVHVVNAANLSGVAKFEDFKKDGDLREITSAITLTKDRQIMFVAGELLGKEVYKNLAIYQLDVDVTLNQVTVTQGFPITIPGLPQDMASAVLVDSDNSIIVATWGHGIIKLDGKGNKLWEFIGSGVNASVRSMPALGDDGALYFMSAPSDFFGIDSNGKGIASWTDPQKGNLVCTSPVISEQGHVIVHIGTTLKALKCPSAGLKATSWPRYQGNNHSSGML